MMLICQGLKYINTSHTAPKIYMDTIFIAGVNEENSHFLELIAC